MKLMRAIQEGIYRWRQPLSLGEKGEEAAVKFLKRKRYVIIATGENLHLGEIDIVAVDHRTVVFVEVKTRRSEERGHPADAVDEQKQRQISRLAEIYLKRHDLYDYPSRFDVIAVLWPEKQRKPVIEHYESAFEAITGPWD